VACACELVACLPAVMIEWISSLCTCNRCSWAPTAQCTMHLRQAAMIDVCLNTTALYGHMRMRLFPVVLGMLA
jgi:hypothetical protein